MTYIYILENLLNEHLKDFTFQDGNSLLECDFLDTYSNYIVDYLNANKIDAFSMKQWDIQKQSYINQVIKDHGKYVDPYTKWRSVPISYLRKYYYGINYLNPMSYKFYIQSLMWNYVKNRDLFIKEINFLEPWFDSLSPLNEGFCIDDDKFTKFTNISLIEGRLIACFLFCIYHEPLISEDIKKITKDLNYSFWMTWKYMLPF
ncbi:hypothetical protein [Acinetobacter sp. ANC 3791]|uniref:hypothetical protein n=1 Tax=Acinetobacter sp. ANC 3791 TaxID=2529836 RepID=UPI00103A9B76|nr:hypothetical protein [Acinetobacter sp. ANC 3791]TCB83179.1 hypothetical protein E0H90_12780 [Acinetobacter sp. ANC 3791]